MPPPMHNPRRLKIAWAALVKEEEKIVADRRAERAAAACVHNI